MDDALAQADTDTDRDNHDYVLAHTGSSSRTPLVVAAGSTLLIAGLLLAYRLRRRSATRRTHRKAH
ncbi:LPXTG cell wall anchor domain-containing protein [Kitasatospora sp. NPDC001603]|uniref:LPXTG cell wall anchor domain-containing protein n=1 Tax=Kitasatospora sp. NPDC001603 TaxID=3154388 RepID=UPI00332532BA